MNRSYLRLLLLLFCLVPLLLNPAGAQDNRKKPNLKEQVQALESKVLRLENEILAIREQLEAVLGETPEQRVVEISVGDSPVQGNPGAPLTLTMFGDYQSNYTLRAQHVVGRLMQSFPEKIRFVFKHYPLTQLHPLANEAALAALAAEKQERFWEYHGQLFLNSRRLDSTLLLALAEQTGLNLTRFNVDRNSLWALGRLSADEKAGTAAGVTGLPTLFLNGRLMARWHYDYLRGQVDKVLNPSPR